MVDGEITDSYWTWREAGLANEYAVRYPVGQAARHTVAFSVRLLDREGSRRVDRLDYIQARKQLYLPWYVTSVKKTDEFKQLQARVRAGENLLIVEVDAPHQESLGYYQEKYGVKSNFIEQDTCLATLRNLSLLINDDKHAFGHGYCLAASLLRIDKELRQS